MKKRNIVLFSVVVILLLACAPMAAIGFVPKADLDKANESVQKLTTDLESANSKLETANATSAELEKQLADSEAMVTEAKAEMLSIKNQLARSNNDLDLWNGMLCKQNWDTLWNKVIYYWPLEEYGVPDYMKEYLGITQWSTDPDWQFDNSKPFSVIVVDLDEDPTMAIDTVNDCLILNPDFFRGEMGSDEPDRY